MYRRRPTGEYLVVCTNAVRRQGRRRYLRPGSKSIRRHDETTSDGKNTLLHIESNAACDYAPVKDGQLGILRQPDAGVRVRELMPTRRA